MEVAIVLLSGGLDDRCRLGCVCLKVRVLRKKRFGCTRSRVYTAGKNAARQSRVEASSWEYVTSRRCCAAHRNTNSSLDNGLIDSCACPIRGRAHGPCARAAAALRLKRHTKHLRLPLSHSPPSPTNHYGF